MNRTIEDYVMVASYDGKPPLPYPKWSLRALRRILQVTKKQKTATFQLENVAGVWYMIVNDGAMEKLS